MREVELDPQPSVALDGIWTRNESLANAVEDVLDWIEADPPDPRVKRRRFTNALWVIAVHAGGEDWTLIWDEREQPVVVALVETTSI